MRDSITVLSHSTNPLAKTWKSDGTISPYADGKYFSVKEIQLDSVQDLSRILRKLESRPKSCVIRGAYLGEEKSREIDLEHNFGKARRILDVYEDKPHHWILVEIDNFEPLTCDPTQDPESAIEEFISMGLPDCFHYRSYHWQLSNSAGHIKHAGKLKAHVWFWLDRTYNSEQLRQWALALDLPLDRSVLNTVQVHYTSAPLFDDGVDDPVEVRSGFVDGLLGDEVPLIIDEETLSAAVISGGKSKSERLNTIAQKDPRARLLYDRGMVKSVGRQGELRITCPRESEHTGEGGESSTVYYLPNTGGYAQGHFVCKHAHCADVPQGLFDMALGYDEFEELTESNELEVERIKKKVKGNSKTEISKLLSSNFDTTDLANAKRLLKAFKGQVIYCTGKPYAWVGTHWSNNEGEAFVLATRLSSIIIKEAEACIGESKKYTGEKREALEKRANELYKWAARSEMKGTLDAATTIAKNMLEEPASKLNSNPYLRNAANCTIDLRTMEMRPHNREDYITYVDAYEYHPGKFSNLFWTNLLQITLEQDSYLIEGRADVAKFIMRWFGYCMTGLTREQVMAIFWGGGSNGKSSIIDSFTRIMKPTSGTAAPGLLMGGGSNRHPTEIAHLMGKRLVVAHETSEGASLNEAFVKQATGGDVLTARKMRTDFFEFDPTHKIILLTNHKPVIKSQDVGIWRRMSVVPFNASFGTAEEVAEGKAQYLKDITVPERLKSEDDLLYCMTIDAAHDYLTNGLNPPDAVRLASLQYKEAQDRIRSFIDECCEVDAESKVALSGDFGSLYPAYQSWCKESGFMALGKIKFLDDVFRVLPQLSKKQGKQNRIDGGRNKVTWIEGLKLINNV